MSRLKTVLPGLDMKNPVMPASGCFAFGAEFADLYDLSLLGAAAVKAATPEPRRGNPVPRVAETDSGMLNAIGLQNPGAKAIKADHLNHCGQAGIPVLANIAGTSIDDYCEAASVMADAPEVGALELNISCPNVKEGGIQFGNDPELAAEVTRAVCNISNKPVYVKLSPNTGDISAIAKSVEKAGASGLSMINTLIGMRLDTETGKPILANKTGGLSGPAVKPVAIRMIYEVSQQTDLPIIGMGGISSVEDIIDFFSAGASAVAVGTANFQNPFICPELIEQLDEWLARRQIAHVSDLTGRSWKSCGVPSL
ncbi:dihydroorotate dehydrogenase [Bacillus daqingensis]|uniref:Dihydroorotate dehydrogenase n=1 Tax=Bacillus daqingensis TaxID=872396 RepID=A0ABV9NUD5_9BACI